MKNVTLSADERLIEQAREKARQRKTTLNAAFREWLEDYSGQGDRVKRYRELMARLEHVHIDRKFTREQMNARGKPRPVLP